MKSPKKRIEPILWVESMGFLFILLLSWGVAIFDLPHYLFGDPHTFNWQRAALRTAIILPVWAWVHFTTRHLLRRIRYLEGFLIICSWCRKVGHQGEWLTMEEYFGSKFGQPTTHGICPECNQKVVADLKGTDAREP